MMSFLDYSRQDTKAMQDLLQKAIATAKTGADLAACARLNTALGRHGSFRAEIEAKLAERARWVADAGKLDDTHVMEETEQLARALEYLTGVVR